MNGSTDDITALSESDNWTRIINENPNTHGFMQWVANLMIAGRALQSALLALQKERDEVREELARRDQIYKSGVVVVTNDEYVKLTTAERERDAAIAGAQWARVNGMERAAEICEMHGKGFVPGPYQAATGLCAAAIRCWIRDEIKDASADAAIDAMKEKQP